MAVGGYFELELRKGEHYHKNALKLNTARNCLEYILKVRKYNKVYIPCYICEVLLEPFKKCNVLYEFYQINQKLEPEKEVSLKKGEAFLYINYFGLKQNCVEKLSLIYGKQLIVDNAQAFFEKPISSTDTFYSARKFFGVADGAYLYIDENLQEFIEQDKSYKRMLHLLKRIDTSPDEGFEDYQFNERLLNNIAIKHMSSITQRVLSSIDYKSVAKIRRNNFNFLKKELNESNKLEITRFDNYAPMVYPYFTNNGAELKRLLIENQIYVATYWNNELDGTENFSLEKEFGNNLVPLPVDQRYNIEQMGKIIRCIKNE